MEDFKFPIDLQDQTVYYSLNYYEQKRDRKEDIFEVLRILWQGRLASFAIEAKDLDVKQSEEVIQKQVKLLRNTKKRCGNDGKAVYMMVDKKSLEKKYSIGVDLGGTNIVSATVNYQGKIVNRLKVPTFAERGKEATIKRIIETIHENIIQSNITPYDIIGIGIGAPGPLDVKRGVINFAPNLSGWRDVPLKKILEDEFNVKVVLENDANAAAWGERCFGAGQGVDNLVCFTLGTGIGGGIIIDGKIYHGNNCGAGELGHMTVNKSGPRCNCGNYGCLEAYSSATGIKNRIIDRIKKGIKSEFLNFDNDNLFDSLRLKSIFQAARKGDILTSDIVEDAISYLSIAIANIDNILNPEMVVLVGGITNEGNKLLIPLIKEVKKRAFYSNYKSLKIVIGKLAGNAGVVGAAALPWILNTYSC